MPKVYNKRHGNIPKGAVYVGRPTIHGNPFSHLPNTLAKYKVENRDQAVDEYEKMVLADKELIKRIKYALKGKDLVCWCAPARCHTDVLLRIANE